MSGAGSLLLGYLWIWLAIVGSFLFTGLAEYAIEHMGVRKMGFDISSLEMEHQRCPLCANPEDFELLANIDRYGMGINTVACTECGMITTNPVPTPAALDGFYRDHYRQVYAKVDEPSTSYLATYGLEPRARYIAAYLAANAALPSAPNVLDVGCAEGSILRALRDRFPDIQAVGVEPSPAFGNFARSYAHCLVVPDLAEAPERPYDLIIVNHVLEHVIDPAGFLEQLRDRLGPRGRLYVDVPNAEAYRFINTLHLAHLHHFTGHTLAGVAALAKLRAEHVEAHRPPNHPASIRALFTPGDAEVVLTPTKGDRAAQGRIRMIQRMARLYEFRAYLLKWISKPRKVRFGVPADDFTAIPRN